MKIWRIVKFKVTKWPEENYGSFYNGDSYIILRTKKENEELVHDVHFWIGKKSTADEYGTAAYKTVELDTFLDDKPVQHREVEGHESDLFKSYFSEMTLLDGGAESGFKHVGPKEYTPRLFLVRGNKKNVTLTNIELVKGNLTNDDCFIIDLGLELFQWNGIDANKEEKWKAGEICRDWRSKRGGKPRHIVLDDCTVEKIEELEELEGILPDGENSFKKQAGSEPSEKVLFSLSDRTGQLQCNEIARGKEVKRSLLKEDDVYIFDSGRHCYVYVGKAASIDERRNAMTYAHNYLMRTEHPLLPVTVINGGQKSVDFENAF
ncbi:gelsolin-like protein 2 isoform X2 [Nematostella vectensis]|nr:gelsolin-like protein 2 isoform X2 [Nematostella vectensis]